MNVFFDLVWIYPILDEDVVFLSRYGHLKDFTSVPALYRSSNRFHQCTIPDDVL
jgi:hypothetical protein